MKKVFGVALMITCICSFAAVRAAAGRNVKSGPDALAARLFQAAPISERGVEGPVTNILQPALLAGAARLPNFLQIAILRWYEANDLGIEYPVGHLPTGVTFDEANLWVSNFEGDTVSKVRASDGAALCTVAVGDGPMHMAFDGRYVWVPARFDGTLTKIQASDCAVAATYMVNPGLHAALFDGRHIWTSVGTGVSGGDRLLKLNPDDASIVCQAALGENPQGIAFDGQSIWVANEHEESVYIVRRGNCSITARFFGIPSPQSLAFDGRSMWVVDYSTSSVRRLGPDRANLGDFAVGTGPRQIVFDGENMWIGDTDGGTVTKLRAANGARVAQASCATPLGLAFDGVNVWAASRDHDTVVKF